MVMVAPQYREDLNTAKPCVVNTAKPCVVNTGRVIVARNLAQCEKRVAKAAKAVVSDGEKFNRIKMYMPQHAACPEDLVRHQSRDYAALAVVSKRLLRNMEKHSRLVGIRDALVREYANIVEAGMAPR